jgi:hypothetical protein
VAALKQALHMGSQTSCCTAEGGGAAIPPDAPCMEGNCCREPTANGGSNTNSQQQPQGSRSSWELERQASRDLFRTSTASPPGMNAKGLNSPFPRS